MGTFDTGTIPDDETELVVAVLILFGSAEYVFDNPLILK